MVARQVSKKGDKRALECLVTCFADLDWMVRHVALEASEQLLDDSLTSVLAVLGVLRNICQVIRDGDTGEHGKWAIGGVPFQEQELSRVRDQSPLSHISVTCCW